MMTIKHCLMGIVALAALAPDVGWSAPMGTDSANIGQHGAPDSGKSDQRDPTAPPQHKDAAARKPAQKDAATPSRKARDHRVAAKPSAGTKAPATAAPRPSPHVVAVPRFGPNAVSPATVAAVSGNAVARHTPVKAGMGGPSTSDTNHGALVVIGGAPMNRAPHFRTGAYQ